MFKRKPYVLWLPAWVALSLVIGAITPGVYSPAVHWSQSMLWGFGYTAVMFAAGYWTVRLMRADLHPGWRVLCGTVAVVIVYVWNHH